MAIQDKQNASAQASAQEFAPAAAPSMQPGVQAPQSTSLLKGWGIGVADGLLPPSQGSEQLNKLREKMLEIFKNANSAHYKVNVVVLDNAVIKQLYYSSVVVCIQEVKTNRVAAYVNLLASTNQPPSSYQVNELGQQIEIKRTHADVFDSVYVNIARAKVQEALPNTQVTVVDGCVVPSDFNIEDNKAVYRLAYNSQQAAVVFLSSSTPGFKDLNLAEVAHDTSLAVTMDFTRQTNTDFVGDPIRADITTSFSTRANQNQNQNRQTLNTQNSAKEIFGRVSGFVNILWAPVAQPQNQWGMYNPQMGVMPTQKYAAQYVITDVHSSEATSLGAYLLLLATTLPLGIGNEWYQTFYNSSRHLGKGVDFTDVGYLNIEANLPSKAHPGGNPSGVGTYIDTKGKDFTPMAFSQYMQQLFRPGLMFAIDVPKCSPQTWYLDVFSAAAHGQDAARNLIIDTADRLTNGKFKPLFKGNIFANYDTVVHLGYYETDAGKRDIRDVDYLATAVKFGESDRSVLSRWSDSFLQFGRSEQVRMSDRWNIIQAVTGQKAVLTGLAERLTFTENFLYALTEGISQAGIRTQVAQSGSVLSMQIDRGVANFVDQAMLSAGVNNMFRQGFGMQSSGVPGVAYGANIYNRWGG